MEKNDNKLILDYFKSLLQDAKTIEDLPQTLKHNEEFKEVAEIIKSVRQAAGALGNNNLSFEIKGKGYVSGSLKSLQASLRNLTWTTKAIADGDFTKRVQFLGDFSLAFNRMTEKLESSIQEIEEARTHFEMIFETIPDATIISNAETGLLFAYNQAFFEMTKFSKEELAKNPINICDFYINSEERDLFVQQIQASGEVQNMEISFLDDEKKEHTGLLSSKLITIEKNPHVLSVIRDITERKIMEEEIRRLSITDPLTQSYNRLKLDESLKYQFDYVKMDISTFTILILDIDYFKRVNDTYGHQVGDQVLIEIVGILNENVRNSDIVGRWGGEEFLIILPNASLEDGLLKAENIRGQVEENIFASQAKLTISIGVAAYMNDDLPDDIVFRADAALYQAKKKGRNRVEF